MLSYLIHHKHLGTDPPRYGNIFSFVVQIGNLYCDIVFSIVLYPTKNENYLFYIMIAGILLPHLLGIYWGKKQLKIWKNQTNTLWVQSYVLRYRRRFMTIMVFSGFYAANELCNSHLFHSPILSMQLLTKEFNEIRAKRITTVILRVCF